MNLEPLPPRRQIWQVRGTVSCPEFKRDRRSLAYHEAGHAVFALWLGVPSVSAELGADAGSVMPEWPSPPSDETSFPPPAALEEFAALMYAALLFSGLQAEILVAGLDVAGLMRAGDDDDRKARAHLREAFRSEVPAWYCQRFARALLTQHWGAVETIAAELLASSAGRWTRFHLTGEEVRPC